MPLSDRCGWPHLPHTTRHRGVQPACSLQPATTPAACSLHYGALHCTHSRVWRPAARKWPHTPHCWGTLSPPSICGGGGPPKRWWSASASSSSAISAPSARMTTDMSLMNITVGSPCTRSVLATTGSSSASILRTRTLSPSFSATISSCGAMSWHGPHHTAKTSRMIGVEQSWIASSNSAVFTWRTFPICGAAHRDTPPETRAALEAAPCSVRAEAPLASSATM
mmetsp:Transcript_72225/g.174341  ORF Transcript_72225/g.174341 Transcript_72225/m.174341 type:complete len:224 (-) Transcript_72225:20-691(-)